MLTFTSHKKDRDGDLCRRAAVPLDLKVSLNTTAKMWKGHDSDISD